MTWAYGLSLLISISGLVTLDARFRLALFDRPIRSTAIVLVSVLGFLLWDTAGIGLGIFFRGPGPFQSGLLLAPEIPVEEALFLTLLSYLTLLVFVAAERRLRRRAS